MLKFIQDLRTFGPEAIVDASVIGAFIWAVWVVAAVARGVA